MKSFKVTLTIDIDECMTADAAALKAWDEILNTDHPCFEVTENVGAECATVDTFDLDLINTHFMEAMKRLFHIDGGDLRDCYESIENLADALNTSETDESTWCLGEFLECTLADLITGAYWHLSDWCAGQASDEYRIHCKLSNIYKPNMEGADEENEAYKELNRMAEEAHK